MKNNLIRTFPMGISAMWNANSLVQDLNAIRRVYAMLHTRAVIDINILINHRY